MKGKILETVLFFLMSFALAAGGSGAGGCGSNAGGNGGGGESDDISGFSTSELTVEYDTGSGYSEPPAIDRVSDTVVSIDCSGRDSVQVTATVTCADAGISQTWLCRDGMISGIADEDATGCIEGEIDCGGGAYLERCNNP